MLACASPEYLQRHGAPQQPLDLLNHNCLNVKSTPPRAGWWCFRGVNGGKALPVRGSLRSDESDALLRAALDGVGVAHLATWMCAEEIVAGRLQPLFSRTYDSPLPAASGIHAVRLPDRSSVKSRLFLEHLRNTFGVADGGIPYWDGLLGKPRREPAGSGGFRP